MPRGGRRAGKPGKAYEQRSDLNAGPVAMGDYAKGQPYGTGVQMMDAQRAVPVSSPTPPGPTQAPPGPPGLQGLLGTAGPAPGSFGAFDRETERPNEPLTHGLAMGPGGGPEVLSNPVARPAATLLQQMAAQPFASEEIRTLLNQLPR